MNPSASPLPRRVWVPSLIRVTVSMFALVLAPAFLLLANLFSPVLRSAMIRDWRRMLVGVCADSPWLVAIVLIAPVALLIGLHPFPPDDLLRDLSAHFYGYDYRRMYWGSPLVPSYDQYLGFDHLAALAGAIPARWRMLPFQMVPLIGLLAVMTVALYRTFAGDDNRHLKVAALLLLMLCLPGVAERMTEGRPEAWFSVWALAALVVPTIPWLIAGLILAPIYWLAPAYAGATLLLTGLRGRDAGEHPNALPRERLIHAGVLAGAFGVLTAAIWMGLSHGAWLTGFTHLHAAIGLRIGRVGEDAPAIGLILGTGALIWALAAWVWRAGFRIADDLPIWLALAWFLVPDMVRYCDLIGPLLILLLARAIHRAPPVAVLWPAHVLRVAVVWGVVFLLPLAFKGQQAPPADFLARVQPGDRLIAGFNSSLYRSIFAAAPHGAVFAPAMEVGFTTKAVQGLAANISNGRISCTALHRDHIRWVVEHSIEGAVPACLKLDSVDGPLRAWRVK